MREIKRVVVLGANGTMGSGAAGLFAARGFEVRMLARSVDKAEQGLRRAKEAVRAEVIAQKVRCGSYEKDLEKEVAEADLVLEAVSEELKTKREYFQRIDEARRPGTIVSTVSSGLSIDQMAQGCSADFRRHFLGIHLFNPPHVIVGTELIGGEQTDPEVQKTVGLMLRKRLGREVVECRDRPAFVGNRVGFKVLNECALLAEQHGVALIDYLIGPYTGRAMGPLATIDLVGWDVHAAIVDNIYRHTSDEAHSVFSLPTYMRVLMQKGHLGNKSPALGGFFRRSKDPSGKTTVSVLDPKTGAYLERSSVHVPKLAFIEQIKQLHSVGCYREAMGVLLKAPGPEAQLVRKVLVGYVSYGLSRVGPEEVVDSVSDVDRIMGYGFNWAPPSVLVELWGRKETLAALQALKLAVPPVLAALADGQALSQARDPNFGRYFVGK